MIIGIEGPIGAGKTLVQTFLLLEEYKQSKKKLITNYHLNDVDYRYVTFEDILEMSRTEEELERAAIGLDEAHVFLDSRTTGSKMQRLFTYFLLQTGKQDISLYYTTQDFGQVDVRLRRRTDIAIHVRRKGDLHLCRIVNMNRREIRPKRMVIPGPMVWPYYNTREVVRMNRK